ncbi:MAG: hypothetical protein H0U51_09500 [Propionibacteriales bacterium]|nr:hypothetical protein [Propionibacteriales bacterium]
MPIETYVRFRPTQPLDKSGGDPSSSARQRWTAELKKNPDVLSFAFDVGRIGPPKERSTVGADHKPVDITITWSSLDKATATFGNNGLFEYLCGYVADAPVVVVEGQAQIHERSD